MRFQLKKALHKQSSIFTAEANALLQRLKWIKVSLLKKFIIFSDSHPCPKAICALYPKDAIIRAIRETYTKIKNKAKNAVAVVIIKTCRMYRVFGGNNSYRLAKGSYHCRCFELI